MPWACSCPTTSNWIESAFLREEIQGAPVGGHGAHVEVGVALLPLGEAAVKLGPRQPVAVGDGIAVVNVGEACLPRGQHPQRGASQLRLFKRPP